MSQVIKREKFEVSFLEDGILLFYYYEDQEIDEAEIRDGFIINDELAKGEPIRRIVQSARYGSITKAAREVVQNESRPAIAEAFVIPSLAQKIMYNLYNKLRKGTHPVRAFDNLEDAVKWIKSK